MIDTPVLAEDYPVDKKLNEATAKIVAYANKVAGTVFLSATDRHIKELVDDYTKEKMGVE